MNAYTILFYMKNYGNGTIKDEIDKKGESIQIFYNANNINESVKIIFYNCIMSYYTFDPFKSIIINNHESIEKGIPIYVFIRYAIENNLLDTNLKENLKNDFNITDIKSLNIFIEECFYNDKAESDIDVISLDEYYNKYSEMIKNNISINN